MFWEHGPLAVIYIYIYKYTYLLALVWDDDRAHGNIMKLHHQPGFHGIGEVLCFWVDLTVLLVLSSSLTLRHAVEQYRRLGWKRELAVQCYLNLVKVYLLAGDLRVAMNL